MTGPDRGIGSAELLGQRVDDRVVTVLRPVPLVGPACDLPLEVTGALGRVAQADGVDVDRVDGAEHTDEVLASGARLVGRQVREHARVVGHEPVQAAHHVERRAEDLDVVAEAEHLRDGYVRVAQRIEVAELARHVVGRWQERADRWAADDELGVAYGHRDRQVRRAAADDLVGERTIDADVVEQPPAERDGVKVRHASGYSVMRWRR